jgi:Protein of unknown function (DUF5132)
VLIWHKARAFDAVRFARTEANMALFGRMAGAALMIGGAALAAAAIVAAPKLLRASRPLVREALRRGLGFYEQVRAAAAEFADDVEDLVAEVRDDASSADEPAGEAPGRAAKPSEPSASL